MLDRKRKGAAAYLEVGIFGGGTIKYLRGLVPSLKCTGVDLFEDFKVSENNTHISGNYRMADVQEFLGPAVALVKGDSSEVLGQLQGKFDLIFIDGNHTYEGCKSDFEKSLRLLATDGFVALHNCSPHGDPDWRLYNTKDGGPWQLLTELKAKNDFRVVNEVDRIAVLTRV